MVHSECLHIGVTIWLSDENGDYDQLFFLPAYPQQPLLAAYTYIRTGTMFSVCCVRKSMDFGISPLLFSLRSRPLVEIAQISLPITYLLYSYSSFKLPHSSLHLILSSLSTSSSPAQFLLHPVLPVFLLGYSDNYYPNLTVKETETQS